MVSMNDQSELVAQDYVNSKSVANMMGVSVKYIEKHRKRIIGAIQIDDRMWRFPVKEIRNRLKTGRSIFKGKESAR